MRKSLSRVALLAAASLLASCAVGPSPEAGALIEATTVPDGSVAMTGGAVAMTGGLGATAVGVAPTDGAAAPMADPAAPAAPPPGSRSPAKLPAATGPCPEFATGEAQFSVMGTARRVQLWSGPGAGGALVFYWHSTAGTPSEATVALSGVIEQITNAGGVVAAPFPGANEGMYPWVDTTPATLRVADEVVACAIMKKGINPARIHSLGYSAGGLMSASLGLSRSSYVASVATYSGGQTGARGTFEDPSNKLSALLFHGGMADSAGGTNFPTASMSYSTVVRQNGGFTAICNHNMGRAMPTDGPAAVFRFFEDHPFGRPSPYTMGLPPGFPAYCQAQP